MKTKRLGIFKRITILVFTLTAVLGILFMGITYLSATHFQQASAQLLNKEVAAHIAKFMSPFERDKLNKQIADSVFYNVMVVNPSAEVYFLDTTGKVLYFHPTESKIKQWLLPLEPINKEIKAEGKAYTKGPDPRDPGNPKIFSAAEVFSGANKVGYIYVILGSNEYRNVVQMLFNSHVGSFAFKAFLVIIIVSVILSLLYINGLKRRFNRMVAVLQRFQQGDFDARFAVADQDDLAPITQSFNKMADLLVYNINRLTRIEKERKDFIANISHDLRTPLAVARGYTETLMLKNESQVFSKREQEEYIKLVLNKISQVENMVKQLFELSKMESVAFTPHKEPFVFSEVLQEAIQASSISAEKKQLFLNCTGCENSIWIFADVGMMERVVQNLVGNAVAYTPEHGEIDIKLFQQNNELVFQIENSGAALPDELVTWINSDENEFDIPGKRPVKSAIGLAIVKKILHLHKYSFQVQPQAGLGNLFTIYMPVYTSS